MEEIEKRRIDRNRLQRNAINEERFIERFTTITFISPDIMLVEILNFTLNIKYM